MVGGGRTGFAVVRSYVLFAVVRSYIVQSALTVGGLPGDHLHHFQQFQVVLKTKIYNRLVDKIRKEESWGTEPMFAAFVDNMVRQSFDSAVKSAYDLDSQNTGHHMAEATRQRRRDGNVKLV